jgi:hypothetical protein
MESILSLGLFASQLARYERGDGASYGILAVLSLGYQEFIRRF